MQDVQATIFLQSLRGNQALIALAFLLMRRALTIEDLEAVTGLHNDTVRTAIKGLAAKGLLFQQRGEHGRQTWIPLAGTFFAQLVEQNPKTSDSAFVVVNVESEGTAILPSTTTSIKSQNPKTSDSGGRVLSRKTLVKPDDEIAEALQVLREAGIVGRKAEEIAEDHHITVDMIRAHLTWAKSEEWDNPLGMAIYRLINHLDAPEVRENGHTTDCKCAACRSLESARRYTDGEYSSYFRRVDEESESEEQ